LKYEIVYTKAEAIPHDQMKSAFEFISEKRSDES
jgi:hypothetical protein